MRAAALHDQLVLLDGLKRWPVPGTSRVQVTLAANNDAQQPPGDSTQVTQLNEATGEVQVDVTMTTHEEWQAYQSLLKILRQGVKSSPAVFTTAHPEIKGRGIKRLYFVGETQQPYSPRDGYKVSLKFSEKLKEKTQTAMLDGGPIIVPGQPTTTGGGASAQGQKVSQAVLTSLIEPPAPADGGRANTAVPGYCSASIRVPAVKAGMDPKLFGGTALQTEANFRKANLSVTWGAGTLNSLQLGDFVFWANDPSGAGHIGVVTGFDTDGMPLISGNNMVTAKANPRDARGTVRLDQLSSRNSQPTSVGRAGGWLTAPQVAGPAVPVGVPGFAPSRKLPQP